MDIVLIGYGKMGKIIQDVAIERNHIITDKFSSMHNIEILKQDSIVIDFSSPQAFMNNYKLIAEKCKIAIVGTTGWEDINKEVFNYFSKWKKTLIYASNFSIGVNIFFKIIQTASNYLSNYKEYDLYLLEKHHKHKKDTPSGTAKSIAKIFQKKPDLQILSIRTGEINGYHEICCESKNDKISIIHESYNRYNFALGAILAAEWSLTLPLGEVWNFYELLDIKFNEILK